MAIVGCAMGPPGNSAGSTTKSDRTPTDSLALPLITLERTPCFGTCPVYVVSVAGDGSVIFSGRANVDSVSGSARLPDTQVAALVRLFYDIQYFTLDDKYASGESNCRIYATDAPSVITSITTADKTKRVEHDLGCPNAPNGLTALERKLDEIIGTSRWVGHR